MDLECPVCLDVLCNTVTLSCGHNFDRDCIIRTAVAAKKTTGNEPLLCPLCRESTSLASITSLRINTLVDSLSETADPVKYKRKKSTALSDAEIKGLLSGEKEELQAIPGGYLVAILILSSMAILHLCQIVFLVAARYHLADSVLNWLHSESDWTLGQSLARVLDPLGLFSWDTLYVLFSTLF